MGYKDTITKKYLSRNDIFADAFNYYIFDGRPVISPDDLQEKDPTESALVHRLEQTMTDQKNRDVLKVLTLRKNRPVTLALLGIESQAHVHNAMPVRCCLYDALNYSSQLEEIRKDHKEKKDLRTTEELLSGFTRITRKKYVLQWNRMSGIKALISVQLI